MNKQPFTTDEADFVVRFMYELFHSDTEIACTATKWFRDRRIKEPAMVNFSSALELCGFELLKDAIYGPEPKVPESSPWKSREDFIARDAMIQNWFADQNLTSHCIDPFVGL